jgi:hypothetical protein
LFTIFLGQDPQKDEKPDKPKGKQTNFNFTKFLEQEPQKDEKPDKPKGIGFEWNFHEHYFQTKARSLKRMKSRTSQKVNLKLLNLTTGLEQDAESKEDNEADKPKGNNLITNPKFHSLGPKAEPREDNDPDKIERKKQSINF